MKNHAEETISIPSRRKFVWGFGILSVFAAIGAAAGINFTPKKNTVACSPQPGKQMLKMLTRDGQLVEIDKSLLPSDRKKISDKELQTWVKTLLYKK